MEKTLTENTGIIPPENKEKKPPEKRGNTQRKKPEVKQEEITHPLLEGWKTLSPEQQETLSISLLKSKQGIGGESFSIFPTLSYNQTTNLWVGEKYTSKIPSRVQENTFKAWEANGTLQILPIKKGPIITHYLTIIKPNKPITLDFWELNKEDIKPFQTYHTHNLLGEITIQPNQYLILNGYTNKNKALKQGNYLTKLFQLGTTNKILDNQKELKENHLQMDILDGKFIFREILPNSQKPSGKIFNTIGDFIGREKIPPEKQFNINFLDNIN